MRSNICKYAFVFIMVLSGGRNLAQQPFSIKDGVAFAGQGLPVTPLWFADSRLAFSFDEKGIGQLDYYSPIAGQNLATLFVRQLWNGFRYYLKIKDKTYAPDFQEVKIWPFGLEADWRIDSLVFRQRVMAVDEAVVIQLETPDHLPDGVNFSLEFYEAFGLSRGSDDDLRYINGAFERKWMPWTFDSNAGILEGGFTSVPKAGKKEGKPFETWCMIGADFPLSHTLRAINPKHILAGQALRPGKTYNFFIRFGNQKVEVRKRCQRFADSCNFYVAAQYKRYKNLIAQIPVLKSRDTLLNNFFSLAPLYHESLKITDRPGAIRAKTTNYWIWGWDGMTCNNAPLYWGDTAYIRGMLDFYEATADRSGGIGHAFEYDMRPSSISALPAQGMYVALLQLYYQQTGDIATVMARYGFAKKVFDRIASREVKGTGLCEGTSLFPDFPAEMDETGHDLSGFNNTVFYASTRSMAWLAGLVGDKLQRQKAEAIAKRIEKNFVPLFFNKEKGFVVSSLDANTLAQRNSFNTNSIRWENNYCGELTHSIDSAALAFFSRNGITPMGLREIPRWAKSYDKDANQLHAWWPATGEYFMRLANRLDQPGMIKAWTGWVSYWTKSLSCPEGISNYIETTEPEFDQWTSLKGAWQAYSARAWYQEVIHSLVGVDIDPGGISFYPYSGEEVVLKGLHYKDRVFDFHFKGSGPYIDSIVVDGKKIIGTHKLPVDLYEGNTHPVVVVYRTIQKPAFAVLTKIVGLQLQDFQSDDRKLSFAVTGYSYGRLYLHAAQKPVVKVNGRRLLVEFQSATSEAIVELEPVAGKSMIVIE